jgi:hypothetical protein
MGMYLAEGGSTVNVTLEKRSQGPASLSQTLFYQFSELQLAGILPQTIADLVNRGYSVDELRDLVRVNTSYSTQAMVSASRPLNEHWQLGGDISFRKFGAIAPNPALEAGQSASAPQRTFGLQLIGSNLYSTRDTSVLSGSMMNSSDVNTKSMSFINMSSRGDAWQFEPSVRWQKTVVKDHTTGIDIKIKSWGPGFKLVYKPRPSVELESNLTVDFSSTEGVTNVDKSTRYSYFLGYRYTH